MEDETGRLWWDVKSFYQPVQDYPYAVMLLNEALNNNSVDFFTHLWKNASVRMCVDGATNSYHKLASVKGGNPVSSNGLNGIDSLNSGLNHLTLQQSTSLPLPHIISGDFDSAHPDLLKYYSSLGVHIAPTPDQDETDFTKGVKELWKYVAERSIQLKHIVVLAAISNERFDHVIANLSTLYKVECLVPVPVVVVSGASLFWLLSEGDHTIEVSEEIILNSRRSWCGLVPLGYPATVTTTGLKWNLDDQVLGFGHLVSTSNTYDPTHDGQVTVRTCHPLLWTMGWDIERLYPPEKGRVALMHHAFEEGKNSLSLASASTVQNDILQA